MKYYLQKVKYEDCREILYIQAQKFNEKGYIEPLKTFCVVYTYKNNIADFFYVNFPIKLKENDLKEITENEFNKALEQGKEFIKNSKQWEQ